MLKNNQNLIVIHNLLVIKETEKTYSFYNTDELFNTPGSFLEKFFYKKDISLEKIISSFETSIYSFKDFDKISKFIDAEIVQYERPADFVLKNLIEAVRIDLNLWEASFEDKEGLVLENQEILNDFNSNELREVYSHLTQEEIDNIKNNPSVDFYVKQQFEEIEKMRWDVNELKKINELEGEEKIQAKKTFVEKFKSGAKKVWVASVIGATLFSIGASIMPKTYAWGWETIEEPNTITSNGAVEIIDTLKNNTDKSYWHEIIWDWVKYTENNSEILGFVVKNSDGSLLQNVNEEVREIYDGTSAKENKIVPTNGKKGSKGQYEIFKYDEYKTIKVVGKDSKWKQKEWNFVNIVIKKYRASGGKVFDGFVVENKVIESTILHNWDKFLIKIKGKVYLVVVEEPFLEAHKTLITSLVWVLGFSAVAGALYLYFRRKKKNIADASDEEIKEAIEEIQKEKSDK